MNGPSPEAARVEEARIRAVLCQAAAGYLLPVVQCRSAVRGSGGRRRLLALPARRGLAHLKPLPSHLAGRTLALRRDHLPGKGTLQVKRVPQPICRDILGAKLKQEQIGHDRHGDRALDAREI
jgi:hypothetical protein